MAVLTCDDIPAGQLEALLSQYGLELEWVADGEPIPGSWFGDPEAGLIANRLLVRGDTPLHSALHESCHYVCMDRARRSALHTNAGGGYDEENAVNYLQILLADQLPDCGRHRMMADMNEWGYTYRLGSAQAWFEQDADDARQWLLDQGLINHHEKPTWRLRQ